MTNTPFYEETRINSVRQCWPYPHKNINSDSSFEMPLPPYGKNTGQWYNTKTGNTKYTGGFYDLNYKSCTNSKTDWKYKWLLGESEYTDGTYSKPKEFGRANWSMHDCDKGGDTLGDKTSELFSTRDASDGKGFTCMHRVSCNLSRKYYWGVLDSNKFNSGYVTYDHGTGAKANYCRAKGITFRYDAYHEETTSSIGNANDKHGMVPFSFIGLCYVGDQDNYVYVAELIAISKTWSESSADSSYTKYPLRNTNHRKNYGRLYYRTDWQVKVEDPDGNQSTHTGGGPWDEIGVYAHGWYYAPNSNWTRKNKWMKNVQGVATMTLSERACRHIWDNDMVCVGMVVGSANTSRGSGYVGSTMEFRMCDFRLLEMERRGDNSIPILNNPDTDKTYSALMRAPQTAKEAIAMYKKHRTTSNIQYQTLDKIG